MEQAVETWETDLRHMYTIGHHQHSCQGLGYIKRPTVPSDKSSKEYRRFISSHYKETEDIYAISNAVQLTVQGQWTGLLNYI